MGVPDLGSLVRPLLEALKDEPLAAPILRERVADHFALSADDLREMLPSGRAPRFANRLAWANVHLQRAGCVDRIGRGVYAITDRGRELLAAEPHRIDLKRLAVFPEYTNWRGGAAGRAETEDESPSNPVDPEERIELILADINANLRRELLDRIKQLPPADFEKLVLKLLEALGYGGGVAGRVQGTPYAGDGGIDGIINEDALGLDTVYVQAKRYTEQTVGRPDVQGFVGSLVGLNAQKGVFVTTSRFAPSVEEYVRRIDKRVILIDGERLASLMIEHDVGVRVKTPLAIKEIDENAFE